MDHSLSFTFCAFLNILSTFAIALLTVSIPFNFNILHASVVNFIKGNLDFNKLWLGLSWTGWSFGSSSKETENVSKSASSSRWTTVLDAFLSILIVQLSFFWVGENFVCMGDGFEFIGITSFIGMLFHGFSSESFSDLFGSSFFIDCEQLIILSCIDLLFLSWRLLLAGHSTTESAKPTKSTKASWKHVKIIVNINNNFRRAI